MEKLEGYSFYSCDRASVIKKLGKERLLDNLDRMLAIRNLEVRAESAYQMGKVGGFFHSYTGQEGSLCALYEVFGQEPWYVGTYRCHGLALLLGATMDEIMAEFYGKKTGNAGGRGGSMHLYTDKLLGGFAIVGGQVPIATGAAFSLKYQDQKGQAICFIGDGALPQGAVHESLNMAALWDIPCLYIIENNYWGMGTHFTKSNCVTPLAEKIAPRYGMESYTLNGSDFVTCYQAFQEIKEKMDKDSRPIIVEVVAGRFRGHSISDPGLYRTKEALTELKEKSDPITILTETLKENKWITDDEFKAKDKVQRESAIKAMEYAEASADPDPVELEEGVYAP